METIIITVIITLLVVWAINCCVLAFGMDNEKMAVFIFGGIFAVIVWGSDIVYDKMLLAYRRSHYNLYRLCYWPDGYETKEPITDDIYMPPKVANLFIDSNTSIDGTGIKFIGKGKNELKSNFCFKSSSISKKTLKIALKNHPNGMYKKLLKNP